MNQPDSRTLIKAREKVIEGQIILDCKRVLTTASTTRFGEMKPHQLFEIAAEVIADSKSARRKLAKRLAREYHLEGLDELLNLRPNVSGRTVASAKQEEAK